MAVAGRPGARTIHAVDNGGRSISSELAQQSMNRCNGGGESYLEARDCTGLKVFLGSKVLCALF